MKRKMEKMSEVSRVKTYKKGSKWVSSLMVTAGVTSNHFQKFFIILKNLVRTNHWLYQ